MIDNLDELRHIDGFPKGKDEDLLALSNPPAYTVYPNPHIEEFIQQFGKPFDDKDNYQREPFVADVEETKNDPIYNAHTYHTKVPYKAIIPFINHYTSPGDIVFDGFCGTGMTGVAAQSIGRLAILSDLSPAATFIAYNYNSRVNIDEFEKATNAILKQIDIDYGWMYETFSPQGQKGRINYTVWSDVFNCPYCRKELIYLDIPLIDSEETGSKTFQCPSCDSQFSNTELRRVTEKKFDQIVGAEIDEVKRIPVLINYSIGKKKYEKKPDTFDLEIIKKIQEMDIPSWFPTIAMLEKGPQWGDTWRAGYHTGLSHVHHFYFKRSLWIYSQIWEMICNAKVSDQTRKRLMFWAQSVAIGQTLLNRYFEQSYSQVNRYLKGTLYVGPKKSEVSPWYAFTGKIRQVSKAASLLTNSTKVIVSTCSTTAQQLPPNSIDYIFTDPPFGSNIGYSDLNFIWESWLKVWTNTISEAVINQTQQKELDEYHDLMVNCFRQMYSALKPGRWITVVFHNSKASVWNAIQEALAKAGFIVAQVVTLDKKQKTKVQMTSTSSVKNDLVINAYKPYEGFEKKFISFAGRGLEADFVKGHLQQLPLAANVERSKEMLYSKYLAYYIQHGHQVEYNSEQFYRALPQWGLEECDGYWFADEKQTSEYEKRKAKIVGKGGVQPQAVLFISDERSARHWIWNFLDVPKTKSEIYTEFVKALQTSQDDIPELDYLLEESYVRTNGHWKRPDQLTQAELEKKRLERLLRQFEEYLNTARANQKLKEVRLEAVIAGFTECYRAGRYKDILIVGRKLDKGLLENSTDLYDFIDIAEAKVEG